MIYQSSCNVLLNGQVNSLQCYEIGVVSNKSRKAFMCLYTAPVKISARMHFWNGPRKQVNTEKVQKRSLSLLSDYKKHL